MNIIGKRLVTKIIVIACIEINYLNFPIFKSVRFRFVNE